MQNQNSKFYPFPQTDEDKNISLNGRKALLIQLIIGIVPSLLTIIGAVWFISAEYSTLQEKVKQNEEAINQNRNRIEEFMSAQNRNNINLGKIITNIENLQKNFDRFETNINESIDRMNKRLNNE